MTEQTATPRKSIIELQKDAALESAREEAAEHQRISEIVVGSDRARRGSRRVTELVKLGQEDYVVKVEGGAADASPSGGQFDAFLADNPWTYVRGGERAGHYHPTQERAILHLIAARYDGNPNSNRQAAFYAGRVLGLPDATETD